MISHKFGAKGVGDVDTTCRCHHSNIMPDSVFDDNIAEFITCNLNCG